MTDLNCLFIQMSSKILILIRRVSWTLSFSRKKHRFFLNYPNSCYLPLCYNIRCFDHFVWIEIFCGKSLASYVTVKGSYRDSINMGTSAPTSLYPKQVFHAIRSSYRFCRLPKRTLLKGHYITLNSYLFEDAPSKSGLIKAWLVMVSVSTLSLSAI